MFFVIFHYIYIVIHVNSMPAAQKSKNMPQNFYTHLKSVILKKIYGTKCGMPETRTVPEQCRKHARPARNVGVKTPVAAGIFNFRKDEQLRLNASYQVSRFVGAETPVAAGIFNFRKDERLRLNASCRVSRFVGVKTPTCNVFGFHKDEQLRLNASCRVSRFVGVKTPTYNVFGFRKDERLRLQKQYPTHKKQGKTDINDPEEKYIKTAEKSGNLLQKVSRNSGTNAKLDKIKTSSQQGFKTDKLNL